MSRLLSAGLFRTTVALMGCQLVFAAVAPSVFAQEEDELSKAKRVLGLIGSANDKFDAGDFVGARDDYKSAYELYPDPSLLYRLGLTSEKLNENFEALAYYEKFIDAVPDDKTAKKVNARIEEMKKELPARFIVESTPADAEVFVNSTDTASVCKTPCSVDVPAGRSTIFVRKDGFDTEIKNVDGVNAQQQTIGFTLRETRVVVADPSTPLGSSAEGADYATWGWIAAGAGVAAIGTGAVFSVLSQSATDDVNTYDKRATGASPADLQALKDDANSYYDTSVMMYVVGGVLAATGATLLVVDSMNEESVSLQLAPTRDGAIVGLSGQF